MECAPVNSIRTINFILIDGMLSYSVIGNWLDGRLLTRSGTQWLDLSFKFREVDR